MFAGVVDFSALGAAPSLFPSETSDWTVRGLAEASGVSKSNITKIRYQFCFRPSFTGMSVNGHMAVRNRRPASAVPLRRRRLQNDGHVTIHCLCQL
jgi:hypothetical protein